MTWTQNYNPLGSVGLSTVVAALPVATLLCAIAFWKIRIHLAAMLGLAVSLVIALFVFRMPASAAAATTVYGAAYGLFPIGWIILNLIFLYQLTVKKGLFDVLRSNLAALAPDPRVQLILIAFSFGAFFEGAAGFGTPVAVTAAILIQLGFKPLPACGLSLIANTAPVAFGSLGTPIIAMKGVTDLDELALSKMVGRQLPFFSVLVPFWVVWAMAGWRGMLGVWPAALTAGMAFAIPQFLVSNFHGPWLVDVVASLCSLCAMVVLLRFWRPQDNWAKDWPAQAQPPDASMPLSDSPGKGTGPIMNAAGKNTGPAGAQEYSAVPFDGSSRRRPEVLETPAKVLPKPLVMHAWLPWLLLSLILFFWGIPQVKKLLNGDFGPARTASAQARVGMAQVTAPNIQVPWLHGVVVRGKEIAASPAPEKAIFIFNWLSATGTAILLAAIISGILMRFSFREMLRTYGQTIYRIRYSLITIMGMLAIGYVTKYSGTDATLGLALAKTGALYPFFGTLLGWLGVALTGSDTASNVLFGSLQKITAQQTHLSPILMAAANSSGGVMGKMIDAQSIVVASTATNWYGHEGAILRYVFFHSVALAVLVGILVYLQAYVAPFSGMVIR